MSTSEPIAEPRAKSLRLEQRSRKWFLTVALADGQLHSVPLTFYPTLARATPAQRTKFRTIGKGLGFHWPDLDFDLSVRGVIEGRREFVPATKSGRRAG